MKKQFLIEIEVDEKNIAKKYPNYSINYDNPNQLIEMLLADFIFDGETDMSKDGLKEWGYAKRIIDPVKDKIETFNIGQPVIFDDLAYLIVNIDYDDQTIKLAGNNEMDSGFWIEGDEILTLK